MGKKRNNGVWVVTSFGADGACAAAMALLPAPDACIEVTSTSRLSGTLGMLQDAAGKGATIHVCGLGLGDAPEATLDSLAALTEAGVEVIWYCGRGYIDGYAEELAKRCTAVLKKCTSNTEAVFRHLKIGKDRNATLLLDLASEFTEKKEGLPEEHQWWQDFSEAAAGRYFHFGDEAAYPTCIRKLAGLEPVTEIDRRLVEDWRRTNGRIFPVGNSPAMKRLRTMITRLGPIDEPVLILGPSGSGKEMVARLLHESSSRAGKPFLPVNCAILSTNSDLAHDRLFGHKAGAFTGAKEDGKGAFEAADDGTLFLDEVAELPLDVQTQLLRVLEEGNVLPQGTMVLRPVNVRVLAATNRNLAQMVEENKFRLDLYHRLNVLSLDVPSLCERREDMKSIANTVIHQLKEKGHALKIGKDDWLAIDAYSWPGNIRQFINILKRASYMRVAVADALAAEIRRSDPATKTTSTGSASAIPHLDLFWPSSADAITPEDDVRKAYMRRCLELCEGNWTLASQKLGVANNTLRKWLDA